MAPGFSSRTALRPGGAKSALILAVVIMIALLFAESCGGDAAAARGDMSRGDADLANLKPVSDQLVKQISALFQGVFAGGKVDTTAIKKSADAITVTTGKLSTGAAQARKEYASIDSLKSVPDYKQYADDRIQSIDLNAKQIDSLNTFVAGDLRSGRVRGRLAGAERTDGRDVGRYRQAGSPGRRPQEDQEPLAQNAS
jgi:hypothetical protein